MKKKELQQVGRYQVGQTVRFHRPDPVSVIKDKIGEWKYLENKGTVSSIHLCESGALITINDAEQEVVAHVHIGIHAGKTMASLCPTSSLTVIQEAPRQMEIAA